MIRHGARRQPRGGRTENNPILGPHPSPAKQSLINLRIFGAQAGLLYLAERNRHRGCAGRDVLSSHMR